MKVSVLVGVFLVWLLCCVDPEACLDWGNGQRLSLKRGDGTPSLLKDIAIGIVECSIILKMEFVDSVSCGWTQQIADRGVQLLFGCFKRQKERWKGWTNLKEVRMMAKLYSTRNEGSKNKNRKAMKGAVRKEQRQRSSAGWKYRQVGWKRQKHLRVGSWGRVSWRSDRWQRIRWSGIAKERNGDGPKCS